MSLHSFKLGTTGVTQMLQVPPNLPTPEARNSVKTGGALLAPCLHWWGHGCSAMPPGWGTVGGSFAPGGAICGPPGPWVPTQDQGSLKSQVARHRLWVLLVGEGVACRYLSIQAVETCTPSSLAPTWAQHFG